MQKAQLANASYQKYITVLEAELAIWRAGGKVEAADWAASNKPNSSVSAPKKTPASPPPSSTASNSRSMTPVVPALEGLKSDLESRPATPTVVALEKDEREEFLRRENELSDLLAEKEAALATAEKLVKELKEELVYLKEVEITLNKVQSLFSVQSHHQY